MDDPYPIEVLHIVNPHVIFVEWQTQNNEPEIQQVGLYGVLPVSKNIDLNGDVVAERCENWPIAANTILREILAENTKRVFFVPIHFDGRTTIFDKDNHIFGDFIIKSHEDVSISEHLIDSVVAVKDEVTFLQKLSSGGLKLKLNTTRTEEVLTAIKKYYQKQQEVSHDWQKTINKQTILHEESKKIAQLTKENLKKFTTATDVQKAIEMKEKDLNLCKDIDIPSAGCGIRRSRPTSATPSKLTKEDDKNSPKHILKDLKLYLDKHGRTSDDFHHKSKEKTLKQHTFKHNVNEQIKIGDNSFNDDDDEWDSIEEYAVPNVVLLPDCNYKINSTQSKEQPQNKLNPNKEVNKDANCNYYASATVKESLEITISNKKQTVNTNKNQAKGFHHDQQKAPPLKPRVRQVVYCPDMEMSCDNLKKLVPVVISEDNPANFTNTVEVSYIKSNLDGKLNLNIEASLDRNNHANVKKEQIKKTVIEPHAENLTENKTGILNSSHLRRKLQDLKLSRKSIENDSVSSSSDVSRDQVDLSPKYLYKTTSDETNLVAKSKVIETKNNSNINIENHAPDVESENIPKSNSVKSNRLLSSSHLQAKLKALKESQNRKENSSSTSNTSVKDTSSSTENSKAEPNISKHELIKQTKEERQNESKCEVNLTKDQLDDEIIKQNLTKVRPDNGKVTTGITKLEPNAKKQTATLEEKPELDLLRKLARDICKIERNVNPFKNLDGNRSVFVEKLISPILMVHTKNDNLILPKCELREIPFKTDIHMMLKNMRVNRPKRLQTVTWSYILRGHSMFIIGPASNGKTVGYIPAICNLVEDCQSEGVGPICIIVCATALSVSEVENYCKKFLNVEKKIVTFYPGIETCIVTTSLLNGCHILICTAPALVFLLEMDLGVDLRRLEILVLDDCERLSQVYAKEINKITQSVNVMHKKRADKALKVQHIVASRQWCEFMTPLAKQAPDTVIAIGASQECVLYSKTKTSVEFVKNDEDKMSAVINFLSDNYSSKKSVIVCRTDDEVSFVSTVLMNARYIVFASDNTMTVQELYKLNETWTNYEEPVWGAVLVCCDGNLTHLNITDANYLIHFSLPPLYSMFCKRFSVLNEAYASIFGPEKDDVKIKVLLDKSNVEQLPKILHFVKRCTNEDLSYLDSVLQNVMKVKDSKKAKHLTPICNNLLMLGECIDISHCEDRHSVFEEVDKPKDWIPKHGVITFKITHYDTAVTYSARLLSKMTESGSIKFPNNYQTLSLKMGMYYSKEANKKLHGVPLVGDLCAVAIKPNFFERCRVLKVIPSDKKNSSHVLINLIDEEQMTIVSDVLLYHLPEELKVVETHVVKVRLANIQPLHKDVTFSLAAKEHLQKITERERESGLYMRGKVMMTLGNCIFVDTAEACVDLSTMGETLAKRDFKKELLGSHAEHNLQHIDRLKKLSGIVDAHDLDTPKIATKVKKSPKWAHLDKDDFSTVMFAAVIDAGTIFLRHTKFQKIITSLQKDIQLHVEKAPEVDTDEIYVGNIVLAEFPDDGMYERARIDEIIDDKRVKCFFVDNGDWRQVDKDKLRPITDTFLHRIPFQAIECRLVGIKPPGNASAWPEFSTCWLDDNCFEDQDGNQKQLFVKYFTKEAATFTGGHKYGVLLIDTCADQDVVINTMMIELNLAKEIDDELKYLNESFDFTPLKSTDSSSDNEHLIENNNYVNDKENPIQDLVPIQSKEHTENTTTDIPLDIILGKPIRSIPLVNSDSDSDISEKWDVNVDKELLGMFGQPTSTNANDQKTATITPAANRTGRNNDENEINSLSQQIKDRSNDDSENISYRINEMLKISQETPKSPSLDSDDFEIGDAKTKALEISKNKLFNSKGEEKSDKTEKTLNDTLDSDDLSSVANDIQVNKTDKLKNIEIDPFRKPKIVWRQKLNTVILKINLIGVSDYTLQLKDAFIKFQSNHNDTIYGFEFELYGPIIPQQCIHSNKGQYIYVKLVKMLTRNWLNLTKDFSTKKCIVYDVDAIGLSSDDDDDNDDEARNVIKYNHQKLESDSEDEDFADDLNFTYKR